MVIAALLLTVIGIAEIYTISPALAYKQMVFLLVALFLGYLIRRFFDFSYVRTIYTPLLFITFALLILVLLLPSHGVRRWIDLGFFRFQPSELTKLLLPFTFYLYDPWMYMWRNFLVGAAAFLLILIEPDLGTAVSVAFVIYMMFFYAGVNIFLLLYPLFMGLAVVLSFNIKLFVLLILIMLLVLYRLRAKWYISVFFLVSALFLGMITPVIWNTALKPYQRARILAFLNPGKYRKSHAYQLYQARVAIGRGEVFGEGWNRGTQKKYGFLPEAHTDFIFSSIAEDFGFVGTLVVLSLYFYILLYLFRGILRHRYEDHRRFLMGILLFYGYSFLINVGMNLGLLPTKGYPLSFVSYGGSHLIMDYILLFLALKSLEKAER